MNKSVKGEKCGMCWRDERKLEPATHKIVEVINDQPGQAQFLCGRHFNRIFVNLGQS